MITVSATAVGVPQNLSIPSFDAVFLESAAFVAAVLVVGAVIAVVASFAYDMVSRVANIAEPVVAYQGTGVAAIICVVIAGWTTANRTIYRAGLAFQGISPKCWRVSMTLLAGGVATTTAIFPALAFRLLGFVGLYATILAPIGGVIFADWFLARHCGIARCPPGWLVPPFTSSSEKTKPRNDGERQRPNCAENGGLD